MGILTSLWQEGVEGSVEEQKGQIIYEENDFDEYIKNNK